MRLQVRVLANLAVISNFLAGGRAGEQAAAAPMRELAASAPRLAQDLLPFLPAVATEVLPQLTQRLASRIAARALRELYI